MTPLRSAAFVAFTAIALFASSANAQVVNTAVYRTASAAGLGDYVAGQISARIPGLTSVTRPNGQSNWTYTMPGYASLNVSSGTGIDGTELNSWMSSNARGTFTLQGEPLGPGGSYGSSFTIDSTPYYIAPTALNYMQLTQQSIALFENIRANGLTGTFTFNTTQTIAEAGYAYAEVGIQGVDYAYRASGDSFTFTIAQALSQDKTLFVRSLREASEWSGAPNGSVQLTFSQMAWTIYGATPVPAPGAIALVGLAGAFGSRRRRA